MKRLVCLLLILSLLLCTGCTLPFGNESAEPSATEATSTTTTNTTKKVQTTHTVPGHIHEFEGASCDMGGTCACGATCQPYGHEWIKATCTAPKTCKVCQDQTGDTIPHRFVNGICSACQAVPLTNVAEQLKIGQRFYAVPQHNYADRYMCLASLSFTDMNQCVLDVWYFRWLDWHETGIADIMCDGDGFLYTAGKSQTRVCSYTIKDSTIHVYGNNNQILLKGILDKSGSLKALTTVSLPITSASVGTVIKSQTLLSLTVPPNITWKRPLEDVIR